jgi:hypothetical protein
MNDWVHIATKKQYTIISSCKLDRKQNAVVVMSSRKTVTRLMVITIPDVQGVTMK